MIFIRQILKEKAITSLAAGINLNVTWKIIERTFNTLASIKCVLLQLRNSLIILFGREVYGYLSAVLFRNCFLKKS